MRATYDDANLILKLYELRREETLRKARSWFVANFSASSFEEMMQKYPMGSEESTYARMVSSYWDMAASFVTAGVLNQELFFESNREMLLVWERMRGVVDGMRQFTKDPETCANLEKVGNAYAKYLESRGPETYSFFKGMVHSMVAPVSSGAKA